MMWRDDTFNQRNKEPKRAERTGARQNLKRRVINIGVPRKVGG